MLDQVEECRIRPVDVFEHDDHRPPPRLGLEQLAECPGDLAGRGGEVVLTEHTEKCMYNCGFEREPLQPYSWVGADELLENFDDWPVGDGLTVCEAASANGRRVIWLCQELGDET